MQEEPKQYPYIQEELDNIYIQEEPRQYLYPVGT